MIVELPGSPTVSDLIKIRKWIMENSPDSELLNRAKPGAFKYNIHKAWERIPWDALDSKTPSSDWYSVFFIIGVDISAEEAVYFKLVWG